MANIFRTPLGRVIQRQVGSGGGGGGGGSTVYTPPSGGAAPSSITITASQEAGKKPAPNVTLTMGSSLTDKLCKNEIIGRVLKVNTDQDLTMGTASLPTGFTVTFYKMVPLNVTKQSFFGAVTGTYYDPLLPLASLTTPNKLAVTTAGVPENIYVWVDIQAASTVAAGSYSFNITAGSATLPVTLTVANITMPDYPSLPLWIDCTGSFLNQGHYGAYVDDASQGVLQRAYNQLLVDHKIQPYHNHLAGPNQNGTVVDLTQYGLNSYTNLVLNNVPSGKLIWWPINTFSSNLNQSYLTALQNTITANGWTNNSWCYFADEPASGTYTSLAAQMATVKTYCPSMKIMVTAEPSPTLDPYVDIYCPVIDYYNMAGHQAASAYGTKEVWNYTSCMAHGCGIRSATGPVANDQGSPDLMVDRPSYHPRAFYWTAYKNGAKAMIYFNSVEAYNGLDPWSSIYLFSGNGDGTLLYPGIPGQRGLASHVPCPSVRLKLLREASYDIELIKLRTSTAASDFVTNSKSWNQDYAAYQTARNQLIDNTYSANTTRLPGEFYITAITANPGSTQITWTTPANGSTPTSYDVLRGTVAGTYDTTFTNKTSPFADTTGVATTTYYYTVRANSAAGSRLAEAATSAVAVAAAANPTPSQISNLAFWLAADTTVYKDSGVTAAVDGDVVTQWNDKVANYACFQTTAAQKPILKTNILNGKPVVRFDNTDDNIIFPSGTLGIFNNKAGGTAFIVMKSNVGVASVRPLSWSTGNAAGNQRAMFFERDASNKENVGGRRLDADAIARGSSSASAFNGTTYYLLSSTIDYANAQVNLWQNGVNKVSNAAFQTAGNSQANNSLAAGMFNIASGFAGADIAEAIVYDRVLNSTERANVEDYLRTKYALY